MTTTKSIRREKIIVDPNIDYKELMEKYGICQTTASLAKRRGWFIHNWMKKTVDINPDKNQFDVDMIYSIANMVFHRFFWNHRLQNLREDFVQEGVTRCYELSGTVPTNDNDKAKLQYYYISLRAMRNFFTAWYKRLPWHLRSNNFYTSRLIGMTK
jgi:hypothetical protein